MVFNRVALIFYIEALLIESVYLPQKVMLSVCAGKTDLRYLLEDMERNEAS